MCFVITQPEFLASGVFSTSADDVSDLTAAQFATHAQPFTAPSAITASSNATG
jgi:hypothetical protein